MPNAYRTKHPVREISAWRAYSYTLIQAASEWLTNRRIFSKFIVRLGGTCHSTHFAQKRIQAARTERQAHHIAHSTPRRSHRPITARPKVLSVINDLFVEKQPGMISNPEQDSGTSQITSPQFVAGSLRRPRKARSHELRAGGVVELLHFQRKLHSAFR